MNIRDRIKELRRVPASSLRPNPKNWRTHPKEQADALRGTLAEIGFAEALVARELEDGTLELIDGHLRAETVGDTAVPVLVLDVDEAEADKLLATLDPLAALAGVDTQKLEDLLATVETDSEALQEMLDGLAEDAGIEVEPEIVEDEVPEPPVDPITKPGDLWLLGEHRVLCGDSTKANDVERLMSGEKADMVLTDPPYGNILTKAHGHGKLKESAERYGGGDWDIRPGDETIRSIQQSAGIAIIWGGNYFASALPDGRGWLVWDKVNGESDFADCELAWTNLAMAVRIKRLSVQTITDRAHPTQKPVGLLSWCMEFVDSASTIYDPFLGSGTTLIAAEQLGRRCFGMEISPAYCDVIVKRWETLTGRKATLAT